MLTGDEVARITVNPDRRSQSQEARLITSIPKDPTVLTQNTKKDKR